MKLRRWIFPALCSASVALSSTAGAASFNEAVSAYKFGDMARSASIFRDLAGQGNVEAQFNIAVLFARGDGVPQNEKLALYWAWRARLAGLRDAVPLVEFLTPKVTSDAFDEIAKSLEFKLQENVQSGDSQSMLGLGRLYNEVMPEPDKVEAFKWLTMAAALDQENAAILRDALAMELTLDERVLAQNEASSAFAAWCDARSEPPLACSVALSPQ